MFFFSSRRRHTRSLCDWSSDVCSSDLLLGLLIVGVPFPLPRDCLSFVQSDWFSRLSPITEEAIVLGVALCIMGRDGRSEERRVGKESRCMGARGRKGDANRR